MLLIIDSYKWLFSGVRKLNLIKQIAKIIFKSYVFSIDLATQKLLFNAISKSAFSLAKTDKMETYSDALVLLTEKERHIPVEVIQLLLDILKRKNLKARQYFFSSDYYIIKKVLSSTNGVNKLLISDFIHLEISVEKKFFILKMASMRKISITDICSGTEIINEQGKINIPSVIHFLVNSSDDTLKIMKFINQNINIAA